MAFLFSVAVNYCFIAFFFNTIRLIISCILYFISTFLSLCFTLLSLSLFPLNLHGSTFIRANFEARKKVEWKKEREKNTTNTLLYWVLSNNEKTSPIFFCFPFVLLCFTSNMIPREQRRAGEQKKRIWDSKANDIGSHYVGALLKQNTNQFNVVVVPCTAITMALNADKLNASKKTIRR